MAPPLPPVAAGTAARVGALTSPLLSEAGFRHAFFTREGGLSAPPFASLSFVAGSGDDPENVAKNRALAAAFLGIEEDKLLYLSQIHGVRAVEANEDDRHPAMVEKEGDILWSGTAGVACGVRTADCVPILLAQPETGAVAAVHAGWRGAVADAPGIAARLLRERFGDSPLLAAIGPHISIEAFEIGPDVAAAFRAFAPNEPLLVLQRGQSLRGDLSRAVRISLLEAGVRSVDEVVGCTVGEPERFFSYRRDGARSGRHVSTIVARAGVR